MKDNKRYGITVLLWALAATAIFLLDRLVKADIIANRAVGERFGSLPGIADFVYVKNTGAAFSMMSGRTGVLSLVSAAFCLAVIVYWAVKKPRHPLACLSLALLFSGALGNAVDRIALGYVVDFISIKWFDFPVFNIADMAIVAGAAAAAIYVILFDKDA